MKEWCSFSDGVGCKPFFVALRLWAQALAVAASSMKWQEGIECCRELVPQTLDRLLVSFQEGDIATRALVANSQHGMYVLSEKCPHRVTCKKRVTPQLLVAAESIQCTQQSACISYRSVVGRTDRSAMLILVGARFFRNQDVRSGGKMRSGKSSLDAHIMLSMLPTHKH